ncbi:Inositol oxygenase 4 [Cocos nucifera]|uniref:Inositol oxygenase n=1 Tax=Cocos nucifera TaxID=13894 RepID=A0A8K0IUB2_COCNU|nr:Inositol oxygenase 4 [Cocos nucifera]
MTVIVLEPVLEGGNNDQDVESYMEQKNDGDLSLDGGFVVPKSNAFGHSFRDYEKESERKATVEDFYRTNHVNQTYELAKRKKEEYGKLNKAVMSIWECIELLNEYVDESDPDLDVPQIQHLLQSAEAIRHDYPDEDWLHLTALIHGDTFPLGCAFDESIVHHQYFKDNPDYDNPLFRTRLGIYTENCGLDSVTMSWGHDEYMYLVMKENGTSLPPAAFFIVRFHSFYPLHRAGAYTYLMNDEDKDMLKWLHVFNKYDLYSKSKVRIDVEEVKPYYLSLIKKVTFIYELPFYIIHLYDIYQNL